MEESMCSRRRRWQLWLNMSAIATSNWYGRHMCDGWVIDLEKYLWCVTQSIEYKKMNAMGKDDNIILCFQWIPFLLHKIRKWFIWIRGKIDIHCNCYCFIIHVNILYHYSNGSERFNVIALINANCGDLLAFNYGNVSVCAFEFIISSNCYYLFSIQSPDENLNWHRWKIYYYYIN